MQHAQRGLGLPTIAEQVQDLLHLSDREIAERTNLRLKAVKQARRTLTGGSTTGWTPAAKAWAIRQSNAGVSAEVVARGVKARFNIDKKPNAIIGLVWRANNPDAGKNRKPAPRKPVPAPEPRPAPKVVDAAIPVGDLRRLEQLEGGHCRWPIGEPGQPGFGFCPHKSAPNKPYCDSHLRAAHAPQRRSSTLEAA